MKISTLNYLREKIRTTHPRTRKAQINTILGLFIKGGGIIISLLLVPITIDYLSPVAYGTWLTISSIVTMLAFFDIGIGNGLRNKFSEAIANQNVPLARAYVSTAYVAFSGLQLVFVVIFLVIFRYIPWQRILNTAIDNEQLQLVVLLTAIAMAAKLVLDILSYILLAVQESSISGLIAFVANLLILIGTVLLTQFSHENLILLAIVTSVSPIIILLVAGLILYRGRLKAYRPSFRLADAQYGKGLLSLGYKFFFIQIAVIILFYTDNLIITQLFGPAEVTTYNIAFRYFNAINTVFAIAITPYWSAFTEAQVKNDVPWMVRTYQYMKWLWFATTLVIVAMILLSTTMYNVWIGDRVSVPFELSAAMGLSVVIACWNNITVSVINGLGKIQLQLYLSVLASIINIPLSIYFGKYLGLGSTGVILATCATLFVSSVASGIQANRLIGQNASGIWNK